MWFLPGIGRDPQHAQHRRPQGFAELGVGQVGQIRQGFWGEEHGVEGEPLAPLGFSPKSRARWRSAMACSSSWFHFAAGSVEAITA